jgi:hypothetical protein
MLCDNKTRQQHVEEAEGVAAQRAAVGTQKDAAPGPNEAKLQVCLNVIEEVHLGERVRTSGSGGQDGDEGPPAQPTAGDANGRSLRQALKLPCQADNSKVRHTHILVNLMHSWGLGFKP